MPHTVGVTPYILGDSKSMIGEPYTAGVTPGTLD